MSNFSTMPTSFDPSIFLDATMEAPLERRIPLPPGDYKAVIGDMEAKRWTGKQDTSKTGVYLTVALVLDIPADVQAQCQCGPTFTLKDSIMLDTTEQGMLDMAPGKNRQLRAYREALDMNKPGDVFSPRKLCGGVVLVRLVHEEYQGVPSEKVGGVTAA